MLIHLILVCDCLFAKVCKTNFQENMAHNYCNLKFEDTIQCSFYSIKPTHLDVLCKELNRTVAVLSKNYIWHRDKLTICHSVFCKEKEDMPEHLTSTTCFGDNIQDEWFIVYLVFQITSQYPDLVVKIEDNDGDFLLIEAADVLPSWANPDTTKNRVFIYKSEIHLITPEIVEIDSKLDLQDAISFVIKNTFQTRANTDIQEAIMKRIDFCPEKIKASQHKAFVTLPADIAAVLTLKPFLISPIVLAFCNHDMTDAKCFKSVKFEDCLTIPVLFTKYLFAMLMHSKLPNESKCANMLQSNKEIALGKKLAYGFAIIMSKLSNDIFSTTEYSNFIKNLTNNGYFKNNIEGSKCHNKLLEDAKEYFSSVACPISSYYCNYIMKLMSKEEFNYMKDSLKNQNSANQHDISADDTEWLNINPDELNTFMNTHYGKKIMKNHTSTTPQVTSELTNFLKKTSDFEGIEYINEENSENERLIEFDSDQFVRSIEKMLSIISGDNNKEDYDSEFSEEDDGIVDTEENVEEELASKLHYSVTNDFNDENIVKNLLLSIREEGITGPSSNVLKNINVSKFETLDSDDE